MYINLALTLKLMLGLVAGCKIFHRDLCSVVNTSDVKKGVVHDDEDMSLFLLDQIFKCYGVC